MEENNPVQEEANNSLNTLEQITSQKYKYGFVTDIEADEFPFGLSEEIVCLISEKKNEPAFLRDWRLRSYRHWLTMKEPTWPKVHYNKIDYQNLRYYSAPKQKKKINSLEEVDPELLKTFSKLGISLDEQKRLSGIAVDAVFDSVSVATTFKGKLNDLGVIFCSFSEAVQNHPELIKKYLGTVVPYTDNYFATLNSAVFSDGSFCYIPKGTRCPMELSTYFRINAALTGQFERTLIIADEGSYVSYLEGCLPAGEQVLTSTGWKNIEGFKPGDLVYDHEGNLRKVRATMARRHKGEMITIRPVSRYNEFQLTPEHPVLAIKRSEVLTNRKPKEGWLPEASSKKLLKAKPTWIPAGELEKGDFILVPKLKSSEKESLTNEEAEFLGYYLAEGSTYYNKANKQYTNQFSLGIHEDDLIERIQTLVKQITEKKPYLTKQEDRHGAGISFYSQKYSDWFTEHCGKGACSKKLSETVMTLPEPQTRALLDAYLEGDGNVSL
ncbi:MAG: hypothetical protein AABZ60_05540, partial [Planctomycetota bacterium]